VAGELSRDFVERERVQPSAGASFRSTPTATARADAVLYRIAGLGHTWPKNKIDVTREMWTFLDERAMP
jgi:poly(3-hydroxybutyrate) depolymerase